MDDPKPGSNEAIEQGCICPVIDNGHGKGHLGDGDQYGWWTNADCPVHEYIQPDFAIVATASADKRAQAVCDVLEAGNE